MNDIKTYDDMNKEIIKILRISDKTDQLECECQYIVCPFCGEDDFDLIGLKHHLNVHCDNYQKIQAL